MSKITQKTLLKKSKRLAFLASITALLAVSCSKEQAMERVENEQGNQDTKVSKFLKTCTLESACLWMPSQADSPYSISASRPYALGTGKLVVMNLKEDKVELLQVDSDGRSANINNLSPVASIPIDLYDLKCKENSFGECENEEERNTDADWQNRKDMTLKLGEFEVDEINSLPIQMSKVFGSNCFSGVSQEVLEAKVEDNFINFKIKKTYTADPDCLDDVASATTYDELISGLRNSTFSIDYSYSIAKLSAVAGKDYQAINYIKDDEDKFGFFKTDTKAKTVDHHSHVQGLRSSMMNRWDPNRGAIKYYLNADFYKPEMKHILDATHTAIKTINASLKKAGAKISIALENGTGKNLGDIRNSSIILVTDPQASGVIGYGPSVTNPQTGEILSARTVMYFGTIEKFISRSYDELVDEALSNAVVAARAAGTPDTSDVSSDETTPDSGLTINTDLLSGINIAALNMFDVKNLDLGRLEKSSDTLNSFLNTIDSNQDIDLSALTPEKMNAAKELYEQDVKSTFFNASDVNFDGAVITALSETLANGEDLKHWDELTEEERAHVIKLLVPYVWVPTLVHEFGHNLGLRHNFYGSTDKENFYTEEERQALGLRRDVTYSSIMDYTYSTTNELQVMGKYDIAALKFAYAREVEGTDKKMYPVYSTIEAALGPDRIITFVNREFGKKISTFNEVVDMVNPSLEAGQAASATVNFAKQLLPELVAETFEDIIAHVNSGELPAEAVEVIIGALAEQEIIVVANFAELVSKINAAPLTLEQASAVLTQFQTLGDPASIKAYKYCSDEHVSNNPTCNRFDEGLNVAEVAAHYAKSYKKYYSKRNFRGRRYSFSSRRGDLSYVMGLFNRFSTFRDFFDRYDARAASGDYDNEAEWMANPTLVNYKKAADISFETLMETIETPAYHCVKLNKETGAYFDTATFSAMALTTPLKGYGITFDIKNGCEIIDGNFNEDKNIQYFSAGKYFNNSLDLLKNSDEVSDGADQIDVRGFWMDKMIAADMITSRFKSPTSTGQATNSSFLDYPEYSERFNKFMDALLTSKLEKEITLSSFDKVAMMENPKFDIEDRKSKKMIPRTTKISYDLEGSHIVNKSYNRLINGFFGLDLPQTDMKGMFVNFIKRNEVNSRNSNSTADRFNENYKKYDVNNLTGLNTTNLSGDYAKILKITSSDGVESVFGIKAENTKALELAELSLISSITKDDIKAALDQFEAAVPSLDSLTANQKYAYELAKEGKLKTVVLKQQKMNDDGLTVDRIITSLKALSL